MTLFLEKSVTSGEEIDEAAFATLDHTRSLLADLLRCSELEIALVPNTGIGINIAAHGMDLKKGENVVLPINEFPSNYYPWAALKRKGVDIKFAQMEKGCVTPQTIENAIDANTRAVSLSGVDYSRGYRPDIIAIGEVCRKKRVALVVDGMQMVGVLDLNVKDYPIDVLACGGGKWLMGPQGSGFCYIDEDAQNWLKPTFMTWLSFRSSFDFENLLTRRFDPFPGARKFELGTYPYADYVGLKESLSLISEVGIVETWKSARYVSGLLLDFLKTSDYEILSPTDNSRRSSIVAFTCEHVDILYDDLRQRDFVLSKREGAIRVSCHFYNTEEEIQALIDVLKKAE
jgi:selenocysteine lyase/cysteine desulfurase